MNYFVFNINESCDRDNTIDAVKTTNLDKIIVSILGDSGNGRPGEIQHYITADSDDFNKIAHLRELYLDQDLVDSNFDTFINELASDLMNAELVEDKDGSKRRNRRITPGILIIKQEAGRLTLLKLEETSSIDTSTYEFRTAFMTDRRYYKAAIIKKSTINVVDKNRVVANYWSHDFLHLKKERDDRENSRYLVDKITSDELVAKEITDTELRKTISGLIRERILLDARFEPDQWIEEINNSISTEGKFFSVTDIFSAEALDLLDESFVIDKKYAKQKFRAEIEVSSTLKIEATNIAHAIRSQQIKYEDGYIKIQVPLVNRDRVRQNFEEMR